MKSLCVLGIESSCDETAVAVVRRDEAGTRVLSNLIHSQVVKHAVYGGVVPEIAARAHVETIDSLCRLALQQAAAGGDFTPADLDAVAATAAPA